MCTLSTNANAHHIVSQPPGGVVEGQIFLAPLPADFGDNLPRVNIPTGQWKDGLFDIFNAGIFHPSVVCGFCFTQGEFHITVQLCLLCCVCMLF